MGPMPLRPAIRFAQTSSVPMPHAQTRPTPVTTTRRFTARLPHAGSSPGRSIPLGLGMLFDVVDGVLDRRNLLGVLVRNFDSEGFLERHDQLDGVQRVRTEVVDKRRRRRHLGLIHSELLDNDLLDTLLDTRHRSYPSAVRPTLLMPAWPRLPRATAPL